MSRSLKKITHKYEFLKLELEEVEEELEEYLSVWTKHFGKYFAQKKSEMWVNEETGEMRETPPVEDEADLDKPPKKKKPQKLKSSIKNFPLILIQTKEEILMTLTQLRNHTKRRI